MSDLINPLDVLENTDKNLLKLDANRVAIYYSNVAERIGKLSQWVIDPFDDGIIEANACRNGVICHDEVYDRSHWDLKGRRR